MKRAAVKLKGSSGNNQFRIIGGEWRGRKFKFPDIEAIRPTPDRVRETLFNWLQPHILGAKCLDLFSGSGAVGLEALSRGAARVTFVEQDRNAVTAIKSHLQLLKGNGEVCQREALSYLEGGAESTPFDLIFLDPPFGKGLIAKVSQLLEESRLIHEKTVIYLESEQPITADVLPSGFYIDREKQAGQVWYGLAKFIETEAQS
ncbi:MAG: 16S rRNA (guanine(966)-N(2))-methyltransferase RsmD [Chromatiales bacterium]|nr:16S rRNA (guanine(966)-N(2))-methyltransferase RsmD [Chromatiales bacterium]